MLPGLCRATQKLYIFLIVYLTGRTPPGRAALLFFLFSIALFVKLYIAEIKRHIDGDFHDVEHIEEPAEVKQPARSGAGAPEHEFADDSENVSNPDKELKKQAFSLCGSGRPGFPDGNRPGKPEAEYHQCL